MFHRLLIALVLLFALRMDASDIFLHVDGAPGESRSSRHADWIEVHSISYGVHTLPLSPPAFSPLVIIKSLDKASPILINHCATGRILSNAVLEIVRSDASRIRYLQLKLAKVLVSGVDLSAGSPEIPIESVSLNFTKVQWTYTEVNADGKALRDISSTWDSAANIGSGGTIQADTDNDGLPDDYEKLFGLNVSLPDADGDLDNDRMTNIEEFRAGTLPNRADSIFRVSGIRTESGAASLNWDPAPGKTYRLMGAASPDQPFQFIRFVTEAELADGQLQVETTSNFAFFILEAE
jgi:type VI secretion system secreted protein Hcp